MINSICIVRSKKNVIKFPVLEGLTVDRALTLKDGLKKQFNKQYDCLIVEDITDEEIGKIISIITTDYKLNDNTLLYLLSAPETELTEGLITDLRNLIGNNKQVVTDSKYKDGVTYDSLLPELNLIHDNMHTDTSTPKHVDLNIAAEAQLQNLDSVTEKANTLQIKVKSLEEELRLAQEYIEKITNESKIAEVSTGGAEADRLYDENDDLKTKLKALEPIQEEVERLKNKVNDINLSLSMESKTTENLRQMFKKVYEYGLTKKNENLTLLSKADSAENVAALHEAEVNDLNAKITELNNKVDSYIATIARLTDERDEAKADTETAVKAANVYKDRVDALDKVVNDKEQKLRDLAIQLNAARSEAASLKTYDINELKARANEGGSVQEILEGKLAKAKQDIRELDNKFQAVSRDLASVTSKYEEAQQRLATYSRMLDGENTGNNVITWTAQVQARVLAFIGNAGQGSSTVAATVAKTLFDAGKNVVVIDCDFRMPVMHEIFNVQPMLEFTSFTTVPGELKTSLGKLLVVGMPAVTMCQKELIINVAQSKNGKAKLDLLSGILSPRSPSEINNMPFNFLCAELARAYDYIIVDLGMAEGSGGISRQQCAFMTYSNRKFVVTNNALPFVKSITERLISASIDIDKTEFVLNQVQTKTDKVLGNILNRVVHYYSIDYDKSMAGRLACYKPGLPAIRDITKIELGSK